MELAALGRWPGIAGRTAVVTGASRGIGQAVAEALARQGAIVVGTATSEAGAAAIESRLAELADPCAGRVLDVTDQTGIDAFWTEITERFAAPTIVVNNAGITRDDLLLRMKADAWEQVIATNLSSLYRVCKAALRGMTKARHGRIINIGSVVGLTGNPGQANYAAAKAGMVGFAKSLAREVASRNITVNTIAPGFIDTDMTRALDESQVEALCRQIPSGRLGMPEDVAAAAVYLASDAGAYVTGETLNINGGLHMQ